PWNVASRYLVGAGRPFRGRPLRILLRDGLPESSGGVPAARGPREMAPLVLAGDEPAAGGDVPNPEYDRDGGALFAEPSEQGDGDRLPVGPRHRRVAPGRLGALARVGTGEHDGPLGPTAASCAALRDRFGVASPAKSDSGGAHD